MTMRYVDVALTISSASSTKHEPTQSIWFRSQRPHPFPFAPASMASSILCSPLNMCWRCSAARYQGALLALASTGSPTASPRSSPKCANCAQPEIGQRLAGYGDLSPGISPFASDNPCSTSFPSPTRGSNPIWRSIGLLSCWLPPAYWGFLMPVLRPDADNCGLPVLCP
jgi:hypothetical protein